MADWPARGERPWDDKLKAYVDATGLTPDWVVSNAYLRSGADFTTEPPAPGVIFGLADSDDVGIPGDSPTLLGLEVVPITFTEGYGLRQFVLSPDGLSLTEVTDDGYQRTTVGGGQFSSFQTEDPTGAGNSDYVDVNANGITTTAFRPGPEGEPPAESGFRATGEGDPSGAWRIELGRKFTPEGESAEADNYVIINNAQITAYEDGVPTSIRWADLAALVEGMGGGMARMSLDGEDAPPPPVEHLTPLPV